ncbi:MAG: TolC family protein [Bacteroidota bacterium]
MKILIGILLMGITLNLAAQEKQNLRLEDALNKALQNNFGIIITQKSKEIAELQNTWGNTGALPNIQFVSSGNISEDFGDSDNYTTKQFNSSVEMNWTIFRGFSARIQKNRLEELENLSQGNVAVVVENTIFNVILAYYNILLANEQASIAENNMELSGDRFKRAEHSKEIGAMDTYELLQAKNAYLKDSSDFLSAKAAYRNAIRELNYHMAEPLESKYDFISQFIPDTTRFEYTGLQNQMVENNYTLKNQYMNLELARLDVKSSKSAWYPSISFTGSAGYSDLEQDYENINQFNQDQTGYNTTAGISISYTLFDGNSRKRALEAARMEKDISEVQTEEMELDLKNQLAQEFELYKVRKQLLQVARENLESAALNLRLSREKFESGSINSFNFRDVQQIHMSAAYEYQNAVFRVIQSYHTLLRLTGGIIDEYE